MMNDRPTKVLFVCHNHPAVQPGGAEQYAFEFYEALRSTEEVEPFFLARAPVPDTGLSPRHKHTVIASVNDDPNQYFMHTDQANWNWLFDRPNDKQALQSYGELLQAIQPDIVHFQHTLFIGYDAIRVTRAALPNAPILYTLHDFIPICHRNGQMVRTIHNRLCREASPRRCHECFPQFTPQLFFMRERFIRSQLALVDRFVAPSRFLRQRYIEWGIPADRIMFEDYGRLPVERIAGDDDRAVSSPRNRFAFFGQFTPFKGADLLLEAMKILGDDFDAHLYVRGANLEVQSDEFQERFKPLLEETRETVTVGGSYSRSQISELMAKIDWVVVPSIWWENSPLVIQEAFLHGRPVICSDIGGMEEKVTNGVDGLHFRRGDAEHLAEVIERAATTPGLWEELAAGIPEVHPMDTHVANMTAVYRDLLEQGVPGPAADRSLTGISNA